MRICGLEDCNEKHYAKGYCKLHFYRVFLGISPKKEYPKFCTVEGCGERYWGKGYCHNHYTKLIQIPLYREKHPVQERVKKICSVEGCSKKHYAHGLCRTHWARVQRTGHTDRTNYNNSGICLLDGCGNKSFAKGYCNKHYARILRYGDPNICNRRWLAGENNPRWNGGNSEYKDHALMKRLRLLKLRSVNYICEVCGKPATEVHHKDRDKSHHELSNFVAVCRKCHLHEFHRHPHKRKYSEYSLQEMAVLSGVSAATIRHYFVAPHKVAEKSIVKIEAALNRRKAVGE